MVVMHTRWHDDDLIGRVVAEGDWVNYFDWLDGKKAQWVRLTLPAVAEKDEPYRKQGEALWPTRYDLNELNSIKKDIGGYEWSALYQQNPIDEENRVFNPAWFKQKDYSEIENINTVNYLTIDTKATADANAGTDYIGLTLNFVDNQNQWHLMSERRKMSLKDLIDLLFTWHTNYKLAKIGIEKTAFTEGMQLYLSEEQRKRNHYLPLVDLKHGGTKKELRIEALQPRYENGNIYHLTRYGKNQCADLEEELLRFPKAINDDASDSAAYQNQLVEYQSIVEEDISLYNIDYL
jgi:phage terminase large subunit-like protein